MCWTPVARETVAALGTTDCIIYVYDKPTDTLTAQAFYEVEPSAWTGPARRTR